MFPFPKIRSDPGRPGEGRPRWRPREPGSALAPWLRHSPAAGGQHTQPSCSWLGRNKQSTFVCLEGCFSNTKASGTRGAPLAVGRLFARWIFNFLPLIASAPARAFFLILLPCNPPLLLKLNINFPGKDNTALSTILRGEAQGSKTQDEVELKPLNPVVGDHGRLPKTWTGQACAQHCYARWHLVETPDKKTELRHLAKMFICRILLPWFYSDAADDPAHINVPPHG